MKSKLQNVTSRLLAVYMMIGCCFAGFSCTDPETTDSGQFAIHYAGVTDIGPSMTFNLAAPTYIGGSPSDFAIIRVTFNGEVYETDCFQVTDTGTGTIGLSGTDELPVGTYCLSISCRSNGSYYEFKDIITVHMLAKVPEGIKVEPGEVTVDLANLGDESACAQVTTEEETHVHIKRYDIIQEKGKEYFAITQTGKITVNSKYDGEILPGKYTLNLKLETDAGEGIYEEAVIFNITSSPLVLTYNPSNVKVEQDEAYTSNAPFLKGSPDGLSYKIKSVSPETSAISIDERTGVITLAADNGFEVGDKLEVVVTATNEYGSKDFEESPFVINIVDYIHPITKLVYEDQEKTQSVAFEFSPKEVDGDELEYSFVDLPSELTGKLLIDNATGKISAGKGILTEVKDYQITVKVGNTKGDKSTTFALSIKANPNYFDVLYYGNNLGLTPAQDYADQFEFEANNDYKTKTFPVTSNIPSGRPVKWSITNKGNALKNATISQDGTISLASANMSGAYGCGALYVTVTVGEGEEAITRSVPVFIRRNTPINGVQINYKPFAVKINSRKGGRTNAPEITANGVKVTDYTQFIMDYRRDCWFYDFSGDYKDGAQGTAGSFTNVLWKAYYAAIGKSVNTGTRDAVSYYKNENNLSLPPVYVNAKDLSVIVNQNRWVDSETNTYANGIFIGQMAFSVQGQQTDIDSDGVSKNKIFPLAIWFDESF